MHDWSRDHTGPQKKKPLPNHSALTRQLILEGSQTHSIVLATSYRTSHSMAHTADMVLPLKTSLSGDLRIAIRIPSLETMSFGVEKSLNCTLPLIDVPTGS
jgi:hypothetical protein